MYGIGLQYLDILVSTADYSCLTFKNYLLSYGTLTSYLTEVPFQFFFSLLLVSYGWISNLK